MPALALGSSFATFSEGPAIDELRGPAIDALRQALELGPCDHGCAFAGQPESRTRLREADATDVDQKTAGRVLTGSHAETPGAGALA